VDESQSAGTPTVLSFHGEVAQLLLNRPAKRNAMNLALQLGLVESIARVADSPARALVIAGAGQHFSVGADLDVIDGTTVADASRSRSRTSDTTARMLAACEELLRALRRLPMPVIVAVEGAAAGGGAALALAGDLRVLGRSARLYGSTFPLGMTPDAGMSWFLGRALGPARAVNIMLQNKPMAAGWLESVGLADVVVPDGEALASAMELAARVGPATPPLALVGLRELMANATSNSLEDQLATEAAWVQRLSRTDDFAEGVSAFLQRRAPKFRGR
jgi:2-(1,2-epoxy-1,2-dihydrophenyl)acetyl-CoA isomerase